MNKNTIKAITMTSFNTTGLNGTYKAINSTGLTAACSIIRIINDSNVDVIISYDGTNDNDYLPTGETLQISFQTNSQPNNKVALLPEKTVVYVKGAGAGAGLVYLAGYYQD